MRMLEPHLTVMSYLLTSASIGLSKSWVLPLHTRTPRRRLHLTLEPGLTYASAPVILVLLTSSCCYDDRLQPRVSDYFRILLRHIISLVFHQSNGGNFVEYAPNSWALPVVAAVRYVDQVFRVPDC